MHEQVHLQEGSVGGAGERQGLVTIAALDGQVDPHPQTRGVEGGVDEVQATVPPTCTRAPSRMLWVLSCHSWLSARVSGSQ